MYCRGRSGQLVEVFGGGRTRHPALSGLKRAGRAPHLSGPSNLMKFALSLPQRGVTLTTAPVLRQSGGMAKPALGRGLGALLGGVSPIGNVVPTAPPATAPADPLPAPDNRERVQRIA